MFNKFFPSLLLFLLLIGCTVEDNVPAGAQLMANPDISLYPDSVFPWTASQSGGTELGVSEEIFLTGNRSLFIENSDSLNFGSDSGTWTQTYTGPMPVEGSRLELIAFIKGENIKIIEGSTASLLITCHVSGRSDKEGNSPGRSVWSDIASKLEGDFDWSPIRITLDSFPAEATSIRVNLGMVSLTTGKIYFDEITLVVK